MIGSIIGAGLGAFGSIFGGISASKAMKQAKQRIENQQKKNEDWYNRRYNEDATQRADAQRILTMTEESIRQRNQNAAGAAAVAGGTEESVAAAKAANNQALASATAQIAAQGDRRKDAIESQYKATDNELNNQLTNMEVQRAQNTAQAIQGVTGAAANIASLF